MQGKLSIRTGADQIQASGLIGCEAKRDIVRGEKRGEPVREIYVNLGRVRLRRRGRLCWISGVFLRSFYALSCLRRFFFCHTMPPLISNACAKSVIRSQDKREF